MKPVVVIDFETTGLSPDMGDRASEMAAVLVRDGRIVDQYQRLMNAGRRILVFIAHLSRNHRRHGARGTAGDSPLVAHNASFDRKFWDAEPARIGRRTPRAFGCSMLVACRVLPQATDHNLGTLVEYAGCRLPATVTGHRPMSRWRLV